MGFGPVQSHHLRQRTGTTRPAAMRNLAVGKLAVVLALVLASCGSGQVTGAAQPQAGDDGTDSTTLPDLSVTDIATGDQVALQSLVPADRPVLLWFWAPH